MNAITGCIVLLLAIAVVESSRDESNHMPLKKVLALFAKLDDADYVKDLEIRRAYQLIYDAATWQDAKKGCAQRRSKLATPTSMYEFKLIQRLVRKMRFHDVRGATGVKYLAWVGISSLEDWTVWRTIDGDDIRATGFSTWVTGNGILSADPTAPHCAGVDAVNFLRDYWCHRKQPYVCEFILPAEDSAHPTKE